ncbi:MAG TPA: ATP-binding cassette domain-containing protein [Bryobacteraceae bacterium]|nr:ATP-binding cassette domain-containing protein [Bryobacteraceae bacterium]
MKNLIRRLRPFRLAVTVITAGLILEMAFNGLVPLSLRYLIDSVIGGGNSGKMGALLVFLAVGAAAASAMGFARDRAWIGMQAAFLAGLRQEMFDHLQALSIGFFQSGRGGGVLSNFSNDIATVENAASMAISWGLLPGFECIFSSILLFAMDWQLWLAAMLLWPWATVAPRLFTARAARANAARHEREAALLAELQENLTVQPVVKAFGLETLRIASFARLNRAWAGGAARAGMANSMVERSTTTGILLIQVGVLGLGAWMAGHQRITIGTLVSFQALLLLLSNNLLYVMQYMPSLIQARGAMSRIEELLAIAPQLQENPAAIEVPADIGAIEFRKVAFGYSEDRPILHGVSLSIPPGASAAFVGGSGSGKSTMLNLLMRFYDPDSGSIMAGGSDIRDYSLASWRRRLGTVFQESLLFNQSLLDNIRMARPEARDEEIYDAARDAEIHSFIEALPEGYAMPVGERGGRLSGGQRQRVSIARAILRNPAVLVLDEATSALDPGTESAINATLARLAAGRTSISVTHRLAGAATADIIFVFDHGHVVESGSHTELLARGGHYASLWQKQQGFEVSDDGSSATIKPDRLARIPLLSTLPPSYLAEIAPMFRSETFREGDDIVVEGDSSGSFYIVVRGRVEVRRRNVRMAVLEDGDYFGEIALLMGSPRTATVRALTVSTCIALDKESFDAFLTRSPWLKEQIWRVAKERLQKTAAGV